MTDEQLKILNNLKELAYMCKMTASSIVEKDAFDTIQKGLNQIEMLDAIEDYNRRKGDI